ncbi:hypothetical protein ABID44_001883 [Aquamicrobium ahrensii]|uniref:Uncharacterized protein n=1 Tax=Aquamicrobium ahrensii TaxID=469551 RepID=A0ABV2KKE4_9HYPH
MSTLFVPDDAPERIVRPACCLPAGPTNERGL